MSGLRSDPKRSLRGKSSFHLTYMPYLAHNCLTQFVKIIATKHHSLIKNQKDIQDVNR